MAGSTWPVQVHGIDLPHSDIMRSIEVVAKQVAPALGWEPAGGEVRRQVRVSVGGDILEHVDGKRFARTGRCSLYRQRALDLAAQQWYRAYP